MFVHTHAHTHTLVYTLVPSRDLAVSHQQSTLLKLGRVRLGTDGRNLSKRICIFCFSIPPKCIFRKFLKFTLNDLLVYKITALIL